MGETGTHKKTEFLPFQFALVLFLCQEATE